MGEGDWVEVKGVKKHRVCVCVGGGDMYLRWGEGGVHLYQSATVERERIKRYHAM